MTNWFATVAAAGNSTMTRDQTESEGFWNKCLKFSDQKKVKNNVASFLFLSVQIIFQTVSNEREQTGNKNQKIATLAASEHYSPVQTRDRIRRVQQHACFFRFCNGEIVELIESD